MSAEDAKDMSMSSPSTPDLESAETQLPATVRRNEDEVLEGFWPKLKQTLSRVPFATDAVAAYYCAFDTRTPTKVKGMLLTALAYFILPLDVVPDMILGLGFTDDLTVLITAIGLIRSHMRPEHYERARETIARLRRGEDAPEAA